MVGHSRSVEVIYQTSAIELSEYLQCKTSEKSKLDIWIEQIASEARKIADAKHLDVKEMIHLGLVRS